MTESFPIDPAETAGTVIATEIAGLEALKTALRDDMLTPFAAALSLLLETRGRVVVSGMGKSGHVARKIAATFASTGTPSLFVHPGEASHGDLGMIAREDIIIALSKSGETSELGDLLGYAARFSIPLLAMTGRATSTLARSASVALLLPDAPEACAETQAPTTSTTMMMALGDALAVTSMRARGVNASTFQGLHPGGMLGAALRRVDGLMHRPTAAHPLPLCVETETVRAAIKRMSEGGFGCVGLVDGEGRLTGLLTDGDVRRLFGRDVHDGPVAAVMTSNPKIVAPDTLAGDALAILSRDKITSLFVVENGKPVGLLHVHDFLASGVL